MAAGKKLTISLDRPQQKPQTIGKGDFSYTADDGNIYRMSLNEKRFAECYLELNGNGTEAIIKAGYKVIGKHGSVNRALAATMAKEYLRKPQIFNYITILLGGSGFNDENVDKQHLFLINQQADLSAKGKAIDMYNKLRARYPKDQAQIDLINKYLNTSDEELETIIEGEEV